MPLVVEICVIENFTLEFYDSSYYQKGWNLAYGMPMYIAEILLKWLSFE